jgi:hypothetical protein
MMTRPYGSNGDRCDCCSVQPAEIFLACRNFKFHGKPVFARELGRWAVCGGCRGLLWTHQWLRLAKCCKKNPGLFRKLSRHVISGEEIHSRDANERGAQCVRLMARSAAAEGQLSPKDDSIDWLKRLYVLPDLREHIATVV